LGIELTVNKRRVEDQLRLSVGHLCLKPMLDLCAFRLEVSPDSINAHGWQS
jgi:hypothetical protein